MPSIYIKPAEYALYGLPETITQSQVMRASSMIDGYLGKQDFGMIYEVDGNGEPAYMSAKTPRLTLTSISSISPGNDVVVPVAGPYATLVVGDVLILDKSSAMIREACVIKNKTLNNLTLANVLFAHSANATLDMDLVISERRNTPVDRNVIQLLQTPVVRLLAGQGQYGYQRRGDSIDFTGIAWNPAIVYAAMGGPPMYELFDINDPNVAIEPDNGIIYYPTGIYTLHYSKVRMSYVAGYSYEGLPSIIKQACADLTNIIAYNDSMNLPGAITGFKQGDTQITRFGGKGASFSLMDDDIKNRLQQFRARSFI